MHTCRDEVGEPGTGGVGKASKVASSYVRVTFDIGMKVLATSQRYVTKQKNAKRKIGKKSKGKGREERNLLMIMIYPKHKIL